MANTSHRVDSTTGFGLYDVHTVSVEHPDGSVSCGTGYSYKEAAERAEDNYLDGDRCDHPSHNR